VERLEDGNDSRVHELQADLLALRNELKTLQSNSINDKQSKRETFAGLTEENEQLHLDLQKVSLKVINRLKVLYFSAGGLQSSTPKSRHFRAGTYPSLES